MKVSFIILGVCFSLLGCRFQSNYEEKERNQKTESARQVLHRVLGEKSESIHLEILPAGLLIQILMSIPVKITF